MENNDSVEVTPSSNGEKCIGNGLNKDVECMCDECEHFLECYPEWDSKTVSFKQMTINRKGKSDNEHSGI